MKNIFGVVVTCSLALVLMSTGCAQKKAESSEEAIEAAKSMETVEQKVNYLIGQAKAFYDSREFQGAVDIAQYILRSVDKDSQEAKNLLEKAKEALVSKAQETMGSAAEDAKKKIGSFGR